MSDWRPKLSSRTSAVLIVTALVLTSAGSAAAGSLITSRQIKNGAIHNVDIHGNTIQSNKIHNGTIKTQDLSSAAVKELASSWEWTPSYTYSSSAFYPDGDSSRVFPAGTKITLDHALLNGDFSTCTGHVEILLYLKTVSGGTAGSDLVRWDMNPGVVAADMPATTLPAGPLTIATDSYLNVQGNCKDVAAPDSKSLAMPSFSLDVGVSWPDTWN